MNSIYQIQSQIVCIVFLAVLKYFIKSVKQEHIYRFLNRMCVLASISSVSDILRVLFVGKASIVWAIYISSSVYYISLFAVCFLWLCYCEVVYELKIRTNTCYKILKSIPFAILCLLVLSSPYLKTIYFCDKNGILHRGGMYYSIAIVLFYTFLPLAMAYRCAKKSGLKKTTKEYVSNALVALVCSVIVLMNYVFVKDGLRLSVYGVILTVFVVFARSQHKTIHTDNLTKLSNRYGMDEEIKEQLEEYAKDKSDSFYVIACDMNNFKTINDTWGHKEGDRALKLVSNALKRACQDFDAEAFRVGGDEFVIITDASEEVSAHKVCDAVRSELDSIDFRNDFNLEISMGVAFYDGTKTISQLIENADRLLYEDKEKSKSSV